MLDHIAELILAIGSRDIRRRSGYLLFGAAVIGHIECALHTGFGRNSGTEIDGGAEVNCPRHPVVEPCRHPSARIDHNGGSRRTGTGRHFGVGDGISIGIST